MAWHHHLKTVHHHAKRAGRGFLVRAAEHHPILVTVLAVVGGGTLLYKTVGSGSATKTTATETGSTP